MRNYGNDCFENGKNFSPYSDFMNRDAASPSSPTRYNEVWWYHEVVLQSSFKNFALFVQTFVFRRCRQSFRWVWSEVLINSELKWNWVVECELLLIEICYSVEIQKNCTCGVCLVKKTRERRVQDRQWRRRRSVIAEGNLFCPVTAFANRRFAHLVSRGEMSN